MSFSQLINIPAESVILSISSITAAPDLAHIGNEIVSAKDIPRKTSKATAATLRN